MLRFRGRRKQFCSVLRVQESIFKEKREGKEIVLGEEPKARSEAGADDAKVPPVPIPNTEVKLGCAEDTWLETTRENR